MRLNGPWLGLNSRPAAHCTRHALLQIMPKLSSHWTTWSGLVCFNIVHDTLLLQHIIACSNAADVIYLPYRFDWNNVVFSSFVCSKLILIIKYVV